MADKNVDGLVCKVEPSDIENGIASDDVNLAKAKFNILDLLENSKQWVTISFLLIFVAGYENYYGNLSYVKAYATTLWFIGKVFD